MIKEGVAGAVEVTDPPATQSTRQKQSSDSEAPSNNPSTLSPPPPKQVKERENHKILSPSCHPTMRLPPFRICPTALPAPTLLAPTTAGGLKG